MSSRVGKHKGASAISDRSGFRFPMSEMVREPGTNWLVHRSESDGQWSLNEHPLNNLGRYLKSKSGDPFPVKDARPRPLTETVSAVAVHQATALFGSACYMKDVIAIRDAVGNGLMSGVGTIGFCGGVLDNVVTNGDNLVVGDVNIVTTSTACVFKLSTVTASMAGIGTMNVTFIDWNDADWDDNDWLTSV